MQPTGYDQHEARHMTINPFSFGSTFLQALSGANESQVHSLKFRMWTFAP